MWESLKRYSKWFLQQPFNIFIIENYIALSVNKNNNIPTIAVKLQGGG